MDVLVVLPVLLACGGSVDESAALSDVALGSSHACFLREDGVVACAGDAAYGAADVSSVADETFTEITVGFYHTCGLTPDGRVRCWGCEGQYTYLGEGCDPCGSLTDDGQCDEPEGPWVHIAAGWMTTCGLDAEGRVSCWGGSRLPSPDLGDLVVQQISVDGASACALGTEGGVSCWGDPTFGAWGQVPDGLLADSVSASSCGYACAVRSDDGGLTCWGSDWCDGDEPPDGSFAGIDLSNESGCGVRQDGRLRCWGEPFPGGSDPPEGAFTRVWDEWAGACAIDAWGGVACWGLGDFQDLIDSGAYRHHM